MKDEMMQALTAFMTKMVGILDSAVDAGAQQLPEVLGELLLLARVEAVAGITAWCVAFWAMAWLSVRLYRHTSEWIDDSKDWLIGMHVGILAVIGTVMLCVTPLNFRSVMKPLIAPRAYLIEYCAQLVK